MPHRLVDSPPSRNTEPLSPRIGLSHLSLVSESASRAQYLFIATEALRSCLSFRFLCGVGKNVPPGRSAAAAAALLLRTATSAATLSATSSKLVVTTPSVPPIRILSLPANLSVVTLVTAALRFTFGQSLIESLDNSAGIGAKTFGAFGLLCFLRLSVNSDTEALGAFSTLFQLVISIRGIKT